MAGIDIGVHRSDRITRGKLNRQGSPHLRWAFYEAAQGATRSTSPHADYLALKARGLSQTRASLAIARKLARRSYHVLGQLDPAALEPIGPRSSAAARGSASIPTSRRAAHPAKPPLHSPREASESGMAHNELEENPVRRTLNSVRDREPGRSVNPPFRDGQVSTLE